METETMAPSNDCRKEKSFGLSWTRTLKKTPLLVNDSPSGRAAKGQAPPYKNVAADVSRLKFPSLAKLFEVRDS